MAPPVGTPLDLVIRFSTSNPDIVLTLDHPDSTTCLSLKQLIRSHLELPASTSRIRLIHAGKVLKDNEAVSRSVSVTLPPPSSTTRDDEDRKSEKALGKQPVRDGKQALAARVYIHCSIGDPLTPSELSSEAKAAQEADAALESKAQQNAISTTTQGHAASTTTTPAPRGFDRLLSAGFTPAEIATLRTQFLAIQSHTHTPDTMPTGAQLLALEERWLDNPSNPNAAGAEDTGGFGGEDAGGLEDMLYGNLIGFFWPLGAMFWLIREDGVWSKRKQIAVLSGFLVNLAFGFLSIMN
ncbi:DUF2407 C-terminal domain-containing protein [Neohortaea acidophila]|uniref:DUF2407 C-terminal domain-containing protein n=1 Tax=Neohortaea acidophila TaxID=245834 RepID=A0A6A6PGK2_9PEZI|nr:DUF2407 C-terminal domain-containing protein [Neohortaea acidophila]KAF2479118.1 DUF2407 C-terminal domain-containing protein [Neohortaea acidophila]